MEDRLGLWQQDAKKSIRIVIHEELLQNLRTKALEMACAQPRQPKCHSEPEWHWGCDQSKMRRRTWQHLEDNMMH